MRGNKRKWREGKVRNEETFPPELRKKGDLGSSMHDINVIIIH